ncbi:MAG: ferrous iron transport protein A [Sphaerochaetaceae bacterium]|nr:ferrous iron transport protein A [Sphaerochaetaceae bacterium]
MTLSEVRPGSVVMVRKVGGESPTMRRIMDMGITKGCAVTIRKVAPLGDPIEVTVRGYELTLRKSDASNIVVDAE